MELLTVDERILEQFELVAQDEDEVVEQNEVV